MLQLQLQLPVVLSCPWAVMHLRLVLVASRNLLLVLLHLGVQYHKLLIPELRQQHLWQKQQHMLHCHQQQHCSAASWPVLLDKLLQRCASHTSCQSMQQLIPLLSILLMVLRLALLLSASLLLGCTGSCTPAWLPSAAAPSQPSAAACL
jgi:hypothetical protein